MKRYVIMLIALLVLSSHVSSAQAQSADDLGALNGRVIRLYEQGRYAEAFPVAERYVKLARQKHGEQHPELATAMTWLGTLYYVQGNYAEAEQQFKRSLAIRELALGRDHPEVGVALDNLAVLYFTNGRYAEAEPLVKRSVAILERALGSDHIDVGKAIDNLATIYAALGRPADAEALHKRSLAIFEKTLGRDHIDVGKALSNIAGLQMAGGRYAEAEPLLKRSLAIKEKILGPNHPDLATGLNNLGGLYRDQKRYGEAELPIKRSLQIREKALGPNHPDVASSLTNLAMLYTLQDRRAEAEPLYQRSLAINAKALGPDHPEVSASYSNLADLYLQQSDWLRAADYWRRGTGVLVRRAQRGTVDASQGPTARQRIETEQGKGQFLGLVKAAYRLASDSGSARESLGREMFLAAQWGQGSEAADSLTQMAARGARGDAALAALVRERQDLVEEWQKRDGAHSAAVSLPPDKRNPAAEAANATRLASIDTRIAEIDKRLLVEFPDYAALARSTPVTMEEAQAQLGNNEALVLFLDTSAWKPTPEETFIWVVTKTDMRWVRSDLGSLALTREVAALRCGLDSALWDDEDAAGRCRGLVKGEPKRDKVGNIQSETLPFDLARAYALYTGLFSEVQDLIRDKHLLIVPSGPLSQLPFHVMVSAPSAKGENRSAAWLARSHAITVLPAVSSLKALRRVARPSAATKQMIGFGNPLLDGDPAERPWEAKWAKLARQKQACPQTPWQQVAGLFERRRGVAPMATRNGRPDAVHLRMQVPLHDTADELCAVAKDLKLAPDDIVLGARATEAMVKQLSGEGKLAGYRVVHFATHGTLSGEISGTSEPGLILTPPAEQSEIDDGYLSASEIAALKLDADWVILSACNTAAGGAQGAEALSGLARAFFYAGARALLVSHWAVDSAATVKLITAAVGATTRDKTLGRAEALRRAILAMIDKGQAREAHPAFWAPFVVVGEGAVAK